MRDKKKELKSNLIEKLAHRVFRKRDAEKIVNYLLLGFPVAGEYAIFRLFILAKKLRIPISDALIPLRAGWNTVWRHYEDENLRANPKIDGDTGKKNKEALNLIATALNANKKPTRKTGKLLAV
ncbi:MAG: hypothetical protein PHQ47_03940 [Candidatus Portnoybacteria bacterium]|nr:hypothetical protein [Candidatus Portnoybacteria bacterium]